MRERGSKPLRNHGPRVASFLALTLLPSVARPARGQATDAGAAPEAPDGGTETPDAAVTPPAPTRAPVPGQIGGMDVIPDTAPGPHYDNGFVLVPTLDPVHVPFRLRLNHVSQFRYTNSLAVPGTYTTHLGVQKTVDRRNDIQLTRDVFYFSGFVFDPRLDFNILIYTSSATLSATAAGFVGFVFDRAFALRAGFFSLPSVRSLTGTYPFFHSTDRSMAENYMRPGFTQGVWANGELFPRFNYIAMIGNSLNTLDLAATRIDSNFAYSGSVWYDVNNFGKEWNDYEHHEQPALRVGTAFTFAREDRLSDLSTASPENNATFISDGTLLFETGSLAPKVTVSLANFYLWAIDVGLKFRGLAFNAELYQRWLNDFTADGPLPIHSMYDWGLEASLGYFVIRDRLETYARTSLIRGPFAKPIEGAGGFNWYPFRTRQVWLNGEVIGIKDCPYTSVLYVYSAGQTGALFQSQLLVRF
jgi:hypothetical protein